jgi:hypothetical protein
VAVAGLRRRRGERSKKSREEAAPSRGNVLSGVGLLLLIALSGAQASARATIAEEVAAGASPEPMHVGMNNVEFDLDGRS